MHFEFKVYCFEWRQGHKWKDLCFPPSLYLQIHPFNIQRARFWEQLADEHHHPFILFRLVTLSLFWKLHFLVVAVGGGRLHSCFRIFSAGEIKLNSWGIFRPFLIWAPSPGDVPQLCLKSLTPSLLPKLKVSCWQLCSNSLPKSKSNFWMPFWGLLIMLLRSHYQSISRC